jgi:signal peptidase I
MIPLLNPGEEVLVDQHAYRKEDPNPGDIVVAFHPNNKGLKVIKRIAATYADGSCDLQGENPDKSTDFSNILHNQILGRVTSKFP